MKIKSKSALFMYVVIAVCIVISAVSMILYYTGATNSKAVFLTGIVTFMILYHFCGRLLLGNITVAVKPDRNHPWFRPKPFEKFLYKALRVRKWKDKVLTFDPAAFDVKKRTLSQLADAMTKAETDHWMNEILSLASILFCLLWGYTPLFVISAVVAMLFDAQFIVVQRYNRPVVLRVIARKSKNCAIAKSLR